MKKLFISQSMRETDDSVIENPYNNMDFNDAFKLMKLGCLIKLPSWDG